MRNYYAILGVLPNASGEEIKASFRQLVKRFHPDVTGVQGGLLARVNEAYEVLSEPARRREYDADWRAPRKPAGAGATAEAGAARAATAQGRHPAARPEAQRAPVPVLTRIMSIALPRTGRFQLQGLMGNIQIVPTTPHNLWDTTLRKYSAQAPAHLARHVIQIRLSGERDLVKTLMPRPTDFGVDFQRAGEQERKNRLRTFVANLMGGGLFGERPFGLYGAFLPLSLLVTVPVGTPLFLRDVTGTISVGNVEGEVVAKLLGGVMKAGRIAGAQLTLNGGARAFISRAGGDVDVMGFGESRCYVGGAIARLRAVLDNGAHAEASGPVGTLLAEVNGRASLVLKSTVQEAHCEVQDKARVRLARVTQRLNGTCAPRARLEAAAPRPRAPIAG
jgi:hypothetical protein